MCDKSFHSSNQFHFSNIWETCHVRLRGPHCNRVSKSDPCHCVAFQTNINALQQLKRGARQLFGTWKPYHHLISWNGFVKMRLALSKTWQVLEIKSKWKYLRCEHMLTQRTTDHKWNRVSRSCVLLQSHKRIIAFCKPTSHDDGPVVHAPLLRRWTNSERELHRCISKRSFDEHSVIRSCTDRVRRRELL